MELRPQPVYALTFARPGQLGPNLRPSRHDCAAFRRAGGTIASPDQPRSATGEALCTAPQTFAAARRVGAGPIPVLVSQLQPNVDRLIVDATGLSAPFEWDVTYAWDPANTAGAPSIFTAVEEQLGLKLEARTAAVEVMVIDDVHALLPD